MKCFLLLGVIIFTFLYLPLAHNMKINNARPAIWRLQEAGRAATFSRYPIPKLIDRSTNNSFKNTQFNESKSAKLLQDINLVKNIYWEEKENATALAFDGIETTLQHPGWINNVLKTLLSKTDDEKESKSLKAIISTLLQQSYHKISDFDNQKNIKAQKNNNNIGNTIKEKKIINEELKYIKEPNIQLESEETQIKNDEIDLDEIQRSRTDDVDTDKTKVTEVSKVYQDNLTVIKNNGDEKKNPVIGNNIDTEIDDDEDDDEDGNEDDDQDDDEDDK